MPHRAKPTPQGGDPPHIDSNVLLGAMADVVVVLDKDGRFLWSADTLLTRSDRNRDRAQWLVGKTVYETLRDDALADRLLAVIREALATGETQQVEYHTDIFDGAWLSAVVSPLDSESVVWVARDVTDRVLARQELERQRDELAKEAKERQEAQDELRAIFAAIEDVIIVFDGDGRCLRIAPTNPDLLYSAPQETIGRRLHDIMPAEQADVFVAHIREALRTQQPQRLEYPMDIQGRQLWFSAVVSPMAENTVVYVARDITERVVAQTALEERVAERTRELAVLLDVSRELTAARTLRALARTILEQLKRVIDYTGSSAVEFQDSFLHIIESTGPQGREEPLVDMRFDTAPWDELWGRVRRGGAIVLDDVRGGGKDARTFGATFGDAFNSPGFDYIRSWMAIPLGLEGRVVGLLSISKDVPGYFTKRHVDLAMAIARQGAVAAENANLFESTQRRTGELAALLEVSRAIASTLELGPLLEVILDKIKPVLDYDGAGVSLIEPGGIRQLAVRRPAGIPVDAEESQRLIPVAPDDAIWRRVYRGESFIVDDVFGDSPEAAAYRAPWGGETRGTRVEYVRCFMTIPLIVKGEPIGVLNFARSQPGYFQQEHIDLVQAIAGPAAAAIENARLFAQTQSRTRELAALLEVSRAVASTLNAREVLGAILDQLGAITEHTGASILLIRDDALEMVEARSDTGIRAEVGARIPFATVPLLSAALMQGETVIINDVQADEPLAADYRAAISSLGLISQPPFNVIRSWMAVPLALKDRVMGLLTVSWTEPAYFTDDHARLARAFADQAALAIENARLFERAGQVATVEERQGLARELHDSVSQALYGIALGARTARTVLDRDPVKAIEPVDYVLSLAEAGLAEMRALIFELRPESLESEGLVAALEKQVDALRARYSLDIETDLGEEPDVPLDHKEALYRIAQEALHNIVKHANAVSVRLGLVSGPGQVTLTVVDDGSGFDADGEFPGHLGLHSMRERAAQIGARFTVESSPRGTTVRVEGPLR